jgi:hypothetical protein
MVVLRRTKKLSAALSADDEVTAASDTALGDWYVNRIVVDRRPLLIFVSSTSLLPMLSPARDVADIPNRFPDLVQARLERQGIPRQLVQAEVLAMRPVRVGRTLDRSVTGIMVDFAKSVPFHLESGRWSEATLPLVEAQLSETPCYAGKAAGRVIFPDQAAPRLLADRWGAG